MHTKRLAGLGVAVALLLTVVAGAAPARSQDDAVKFTYAVGDAQAGVMGVVGKDHDTPAGRVAVASTVYVVPARSTFTIDVDDYARVDGQLVWV